MKQPEYIKGPGSTRERERGMKVFVQDSQDGNKKGKQKDRPNASQKNMESSSFISLLLPPLGATKYSSPSVLDETTVRIHHIMEILLVA